MPLMNQIRRIFRGGGGTYATLSSYEYAPDEIQNSMFLLLMKIALMGAYVADAKTSLSLAIIKYPGPLFCVMLQGQLFLGCVAEKFLWRDSTPDEIFSVTLPNSEKWNVRP